MHDTFLTLAGNIKKFVYAGYHKYEQFQIICDQEQLN